MATERFAGTSGRLRLSFNDQEMTNPDFPTVPSDVPAFEIFGEARASITKWAVDDTRTDTASNHLYTYDSPVTPDGILYPELTLGGTGMWTAKVEAVVDRDEVENFYVGRVVMADFLYHKLSGGALGFGHIDCGAVITAVSVSTGIDQQKAMLSMSLDGDGAFPPPV